MRLGHWSFGCPPPPLSSAGEIRKSDPGCQTMYGSRLSPVQRSGVEGEEDGGGFTLSAFDVPPVRNDMISRSDCVVYSDYGLHATRGE